MESFIDIPHDSGFPLENLPWGVFSSARHHGARHVAVAVGDMVVDVTALQDEGLLSGPHLSARDAAKCFSKGNLNSFMELGKAWWREARTTLQRLLSQQEGALRDNQHLLSQVVLPSSQVDLHLPVQVGDYTDFYASRHHAFNVGKLFRGPGNELQPNWLHLPVGYHGRASSIIVSGQDVRRPRGQIKPASSAIPSFGPCGALDFELELGALIGTGNQLGEPIPLSAAADHVFGYVLMNDWSARDIQAWEYVPLGPFNGKNFATQISPWVVTLDALEPFCTPAPVQEPEPLQYLRHAHRTSHTTHDIHLTADVVPSGCTHASRVTSTNLKYMYWTFDQMVAHHTAGGCNLRPGDMLASGTLSGPDPDQQACLLEITQGGKQHLMLGPTGAQPCPPPDPEAPPLKPGTAPVRTYLQDGDTVVIRGCCTLEGVPYKVGFGECRGQILPCPPYP